MLKIEVQRVNGVKRFIVYDKDHIVAITTDSKLADKIVREGGFGVVAKPAAASVEQPTQGNTQPTNNSTSTETKEQEISPAQSLLAQLKNLKPK